MSASAKRSGSKIALLGIVVIALALFGSALLELGLFTRFENALWDKRLAFLTHFRSPDPLIRIITIDQSSLDYFANEEKITWPWPRALYEPVVKFLERAGARGVAFDIAFTEQSSYGESDDATFAASFSDKLPVVLAAAFRDGVDPYQSGVRNFKLGIAAGGSGLAAAHPKIQRFSSVTFPVPSLAASAAAVANVSSAPDSDGIFRHTAPFAILDNQTVLSLPFALAIAAGGNLNALDEFQDELRREGKLALSFPGGARTYKTDPIAAVIQSYVQIESGKAPSIDPSGYRDALVFVGMDAPGLLDLKPVPVAKIYPGAEVNATVLDNLRHGNFVHKLPDLGALLLIAALSALSGAAVLFPRTIGTQLALLSLLLVVVAVFGALTTLMGWWVPLMVPLTCGLLAVLSCFAVRYQQEGKHNRFLRHAFKHYVSGAVIDRIIAEPDSLAIGGEKRELSIFFSDIEGFTKISEKLPADKLVELLNIFLSEMSGVILAHGGTVDKYVGDAIVAFWNAPLPVPDHAAQAVAAALECQQRLGELQPSLIARFGIPLRMRIGVHTGTVNVGNFGSKDRFNYTMIGDAANLASRLEGANKIFGTFLMISEDTYRAAQLGANARKLAQLVVVGRETPTTVFEPTTADHIAFDAARELFERGALAEAQVAFAALEGDPVAKAYVKKIERQLGEVNFSPLWQLTEK